ncbi:DUF551 domain-containing protein [Yersinia massiliensis]|nr:DUF551 domain-containing protein [Yersinia massiliensis]
MKELDSFTVEEIEEIISSCQQEIHNTPTSDEMPVSPRELLSLARIALAAKRAEPVAYWNDACDLDDGAFSYANDAGCTRPLYTTPQLNSPEIPDYKSALLGLLTNRISKDHLGFFTLAGINKTNLVRAVEVSEAAINFENVPQVDIGECLIPNGWKITQDWIKCSDRLPDKSGDYLVACHYPEFYAKCWVMHVMDFCHTAYETPVMRWYSSDRAPYIKYWMPLPTVPEKPL